MRVIFFCLLVLREWTFFEEIGKLFSLFWNWIFHRTQMLRFSIFFLFTSVIKRRLNIKVFIFSFTNLTIITISRPWSPKRDPNIIRRSVYSFLLIFVIHFLYFCLLAKTEQACQCILTIIYILREIDRESWCYCARWYRHFYNILIFLGFIENMRQMGNYWGILGWEGMLEGDIIVGGYKGGKFIKLTWNIFDSSFDINK